MIRRRMRILNSRGLHARAAAKFVKTVEPFDADVRVHRGGVEVSGRSILGLMMLAAGPASEIELRVSGRQATEVLAALDQLAAKHFGED